MPEQVGMLKLGDMALKYILDTCVCISLLKNKHKVRERVKSIGSNNCYVSEITVAELFFGAEKSGNPKHFQDVQDIMTLFKVLPISPNLSRYGKLRWELESIGLKVDTMDLFIGATAINHKMILATGNVAHFSRMQNLYVENWMTES